MTLESCRRPRNVPELLSTFLKTALSDCAPDIRSGWNSKVQRPEAVRVPIERSFTKSRAPDRNDLHFPARPLPAPRESAPPRDRDGKKIPSIQGKLFQPCSERCECDRFEMTCRQLNTGRSCCCLAVQISPPRMSDVSATSAVSPLQTQILRIDLTGSFEKETIEASEIVTNV